MMSGDGSVDFYEATYREIVRKFLNFGFDKHDLFLGCEESQIEDISRKQGVPLPESYISLMRIMGISSGPLFQGAIMTYPDVCDLKPDLLDAFDSYNVIDVNLDRCLVFMEYQAYQYWYMTTLSDPDPVVWFYQEGYASPVQSDSRLSRFICSFSQGLFDGYNKNPSNLRMDLKWFS